MAGLRVRPPLWAAILSACALSACSDPGPADSATPAPKGAPSAVETPAAPTPVTPAAAPESATVGGDGSAIQLSALSDADLEAEPLDGELACGFYTETGSPLVVAKGNVASKDAALGLVKVGDSVERIAAPGGFDGMLKGAVFNGAGKTIRIALTGPPTGGGESPPRPATLTFQRADGASRVFTGRWACGA
ncbi:hypothetical protein [Caulobacter sp. DWR2-3-1b2]|uniref:hypothetical protein n=1 Tax=unclassified Caulobacter TaxID=2648921 RepID=UPI001993F5BA|nr:hypothetical protein [Caulobacter sp.]